MNFDQIMSAARAEVLQDAKDAGQMSLGDFVDALAACDPDKQICFDFCRLKPESLDSYRGYYDHLALGFSNGGWAKAGDVLKDAQDALGRTFTGYKGGDYVMTRDTPLWAANYGESGGSRVVGVEDRKYEVLIKTAHDED